MVMVDEDVVLLHGISRGKRNMRRLARYLEAAGYRTLSLDYPSMRQPIETLVEYIHPSIAEFSRTIPGNCISSATQWEGW